MATSTAAAGLKASDLKAFDMAVAGHIGVLSDESGTLIIKPCNTKEVAFYESVPSHPISAWVPTFFGTLELSASLPADPTNDRSTSIVLSNSTHGFSKPCMLDIKLGAQLWDDNAPQEKRDRLDAVASKTTSSSLGMRVTGMRVWKKGIKNEDGVVGNFYKVYDKHFGRTFTAENVIDALKQYFESENTPEQVALLAKRFAKKVGEIRAILEKEESRMYSASLLLVYEGDGTALNEALAEEAENAKRPPKTQEELEEEDDDDEKKVKKVDDLKLIDFAHATWTPGEGPDENLLRGVRSVEKLLKEIAGI